MIESNIEYVAKAAAARVLNTPVEKIDLLEKAGLITFNEKGKVRYQEVLNLSQTTKIYDPCGADGFKKNANTAFFVPTSDPDLGLSMMLSPNNGYDQAEKALGRAPRKNKNGDPIEGITGWWSISLPNANLLVEREGLIVSITAGWVSEVARVVELACVDLITQRKAFLVEKLGEEVRDSMQGRLSAPINQTGRYYWI